MTRAHARRFDEKNAPKDEKNAISRTNAEGFLLVCDFLWKTAIVGNRFIRRSVFILLDFIRFFAYDRHYIITLLIKIIMGRNSIFYNTEHHSRLLHPDNAG